MFSGRNLLLVIVGIGISCNILAQELVVDLKQVKAVVDDWEEAHNTKNISQLRKLYSTEVMFYGEDLPRESCLDIKSKRLFSKKYFHLKIASNPTITVYSSQIIKAAFFKDVISGSITKTYDSYLLLRIVDGKPVIVGESDLTTDSSTGYVPDLGKELRQARLPDKTMAEGTQRGDDSTTNTNNRDASIPSSFSNYQLGVVVAIVLFVSLAWFFIARIRSSKARLAKATPATDTEANVKVGHEFEKFVVSRFNPQYFELLHWRSDKMTNGIYPASNKYPDLEYAFTFGDFKTQFAIECKFRKALFDSRFKIESRQLSNYNEFKTSRSMQVYVVLGLGGTPENPNDVFIVPLEAFGKSGILHYFELCAFYDNPKYQFFNYDLQKHRLKTSRKAR